MAKKYKRVYRQGRCAAYAFIYTCPYSFWRNPICFTAWVFGNSDGLEDVRQHYIKEYGA